MKGKILGGTLALLVTVASVITLNAASNRVEIVSKTAGEKPAGTDGAALLNKIDESKSNLVDGTIAIDISLNNSTYSEAVYGFYNDENLNALTYQSLTAAGKPFKYNIILNQVTDSTSYDKKNVSQKFIYNKNNEFVTSDKTVEVEGENKSFLDLSEIIDADVSTNNAEQFTKILTEISRSFPFNIEGNPNTSGKKSYAFLFISTLPTLTDEEKAEVIELVNQIKTSTTFFVYTYNTTTTDEVLTEIFGENGYMKIATNFNDVDEETQTYDVSEMNPNNIVESGFTKAKSNVETEIILDDYITDNFEIKDLAVSKGTISYDEENKKITASKIDLDTNEDYKITYVLQIKSEVDSTKVNYELRTNKQINMKYVSNGTTTEINLPETGRIDDDVCSPLIKILKEAIDNPYTGVYDYIVAGTCMLAVALITLVVLNKKKYEL